MADSGAAVESDAAVESGAAAEFVRGPLEESAEELYENAPCGYLSTDPNGTIIKINRTLLDWLGYDRAELVGRRTYQSLLSVGGRIYYETHYGPLLRMQGEVREIAVELLRRDGSRLPALVNSVARVDPAGTTGVIRTTVFEATSRRTYERELLAARRAAERSVQRLAVLHGLVSDFAAAQTPGEVGEVLVRGVCRAVRAVGGAVWLFADDDAALVRVNHAGVAHHPLLLRAPLDAEMPHTAAVRDNEVILLDSLDAARRRFPRFAEILADIGRDRALFVPLADGDRATGVAGFSFDDSSEVDDDDLRMLRTLGHQAGQALERARLHAEAVERRRQAEFLAALSRHLDEAPGLRQRADRLVARLVPEIARWATVEALVDRRLFRLASAGRPAGEKAPGAPQGGAPTVRSLTGHALTGHALTGHALTGHAPTGHVAAALAAGTPQLTTADAAGSDTDGSDADGSDAAGSDAAGTRADGTGAAVEAALPLWASGRVVGVLVLGFDGSTNVRRRLDFLGELAESAGLALENGRLYDQERENAHTLQRGLLAGEPLHDPRVAVATYYRPAADDLEVGGDWYDAFPIGPHEVALVVGDVVGRGIRAASAMGQLRSAIRALAATGLAPAVLLERLDRFVDRFDVGRVSTVVYGELDLASGQLRYACAGHLPPLVLEPDGNRRFLWGGRSGPLAACAGIRARDEDTVQLPPGSRLMLYTDGLIERRDAGLEDQMTHLAREAGRRRRAPLTAMLPDLVDALVEADHPDDVCLLCVRFGVEPRFERELPADVAKLKSLRDDFRSWLGPLPLTADERDALLLACSEATANAIEHGYRASDGGVVSVRAEVVDRVLELTVRDWGSWQRPNPKTDRGRGLDLIRTLMDRVSIEPGDGTVVTMRRRLSGEAA